MEGLTVKGPKVCRLPAGGRWIRTIGPCQHAVGSVMENFDNLAEPAGRLSQSTTLRGCYVPALVKGSVAWLLCLPVGQTLPLALSYRSTLFSFGEGPTVRIRFPPAESPCLAGFRPPTSRDPFGYWSYERDRWFESGSLQGHSRCSAPHRIEARVLPSPILSIT